MSCLIFLIAFVIVAALEFGFWCLSKDVRIVKHGEWISQGDDMWLCSNCKENIIYSMHESDRTEKQRYCCKCGARMDLKDGEHGEN